MTYRPPPVRPSIPFARLTPSSRTRLAQAFVLAIAAFFLVAASATADPGVTAKQAQARQVLAQIQQIDNQMGAAVEAYNLANVRLQKIQGDLRENRLQLRLARSNLKLSQDSLANRLVAAYTSTQDNTTLAVLLGSTSFEDLLNRIEAVDSTSQQDASIVRQVTAFKIAIKQHREQLQNAQAAQQRIVAEKAAQKQRIQSQLASRRQLLSSIKGQIARMQAAAQAQQRQLAAAARSRLAGVGNVPVSDLGVAASTPEGTTFAPPNTHGGVVGVAMQFLGVPYVWGGSTPRGFDCSGLVSYAFAQIGISVPHSSYMQYGMGIPVSMSQLQPGDLVFFTGASHVGIYIGGGQFIHAPHTGDVVKISSLSGYYSSNFAGGRRL